MSVAYDLLTATIAPRPVAFVSTVGSDGELNLAPFSFIVIGGTNPPSLAFSATLNLDGTEKETLKNVIATGEFVVNTIHREMMHAIAAASDREGSKWAKTGFTATESVTVRAPRILDSHVQLECRLHQIVPHGEGPGAARYVIGEVIQAHVAQDLLVDGQLVTDRLHPIARMGGKVYVDTAHLEIFE